MISWLFWIFAVFVWITNCFEYYGGDAGPTSTLFSVKLINNNHSYIPHVYGMKSPTTKSPNNQWTNNWIEFEHNINDETIIEITRLNHVKWPSNAHIRPLVYNIQTKLIDNDDTIQFSMKGNNYNHISVHYGNTDPPPYSNNSAIWDTMLIFISPPDINSTANLKNPKIYKPGEYNLTDGNYKPGQGVFSVNSSSNTDITSIILQRGAFVNGKFFINKDNVNIYGTGIMSAQYFDYDQRKNKSSWNNNIEDIKTNDKSVSIIGVTIITPNWRFWDTINSGSELKYFRGMGWEGNNGLGSIQNNGIASDSFIRTYDDIMKMRGNSSSYRMVLWQGQNGATFQFGWYGYEQNQQIYNQDWNIIQTEYHCPTSFETSGNCRNDAIFDSMDASNAKWNGPYVFKNINIDGNVRNFMMLGLNETSYLRNVIFENVNISGEITLYTGMYTNGKNSKISDFKFTNLNVAGKKITNINDTNMKFQCSGDVDYESFTFN